jgi:hypothetical protein
MQAIQQESITVEEANQSLSVELEPALWAFIVKMINYPELAYDDKTKHITYEGFVPFKELAKEWIVGINDNTYDVQKCQGCEAYFDINTAEGIYGKPDDFEAFICIPCAETMSAREYYQRYIEQ